MKITTGQTWDQALVRRLRSGDGHGAARVVLAVAVAVAAGAGLLPGVAQAHEFENPGFTGSRLFVEMSEGTVPPMGAQVLVKGKDFVADEAVQIFQCPSSAPTEPRVDCEVAGAAMSDTDGFFETKVAVSAFMETKNTYCAPIGTSQCSMVAATYARDAPAELTSDAEHHLCFGKDFAWALFPTQYYPEPQPYEECVGPPTPITVITTTTMAPGSWEPAAPMNVARQGLATAVGADGRIYALGGNDVAIPIYSGGPIPSVTWTGDALASAETLDPCGPPTWRPIAPMLTPRTHFAAATGPDGRIYAIGGRDRFNGTPLASVEAYDPDSDTWETVASLAVPRSDMGATTGPDGLIYAVGGYVAGGQPINPTGIPVGTVEAYDTDTDQWTPVTPLPEPYALPRATTGPDERIYAAWGRTGANPYSAGGAASYSPGPTGTPGTWRQEAPAEPAPISMGKGLPPGLALTTGPDGLIYAVGGLAFGGTAVRSAWVYDTATNTWTSSPEAMTDRRVRHGVASGKDGRVYAIGGIDYDPLADPTSPMASTEAIKVARSLCTPPPADFDASGTTDYSVFRPSTGTWFVKDGLTLNYGTEGDIPVPGDYDGDRKADVAVFRPSNGVWFVRNSSGGDTALAYGTDGDIPVPADYDGDGKADMAVFRPASGVWFIKFSTGGDAAVAWGTSGDVAVPADYDGDDKADLGVFRNGTWFIRTASGAADITVNYGTTGDIPVVADYDADNTADIAVFRPSNGFWFLRHSSDGAEEAFAFGTDGDVPVPGDYNGDAIADPAVFRPSSGVWFVETGVSAAWGTDTDIPLPLPHAVRSAYFTP